MHVNGALWDVLMKSKVATKECNRGCAPLCRIEKEIVLGHHYFINKIQSEENDPKTVE